MDENKPNDPNYCQNELGTFSEKITKCKQTDFMDICLRTCGFCPAEELPPSPYPETLSIEGNPAYPTITRGQYTRAAGLEYGGAPVYKRSYYSMYKRSNGKWYLDSNEVDESWSGTVNYALHASDTPFTATWNVDMVVVP